LDHSSIAVVLLAMLDDAMNSASMSLRLARIAAARASSSRQSLELPGVAGFAARLSSRIFLTLASNTANPPRHRDGAE
jgi:hypothetical protein